MFRQYKDNKLFPVVVYLVGVIGLLLLAGNFGWRDLCLVIVFSGFAYFALLGLLDNFTK